MSSGADCWFDEVKPGEWRGAVQQWPYGEWPEYDEFGPFATFEAVLNHMQTNFQNPGGYSMGVHADHVHNGKQSTSGFRDTYWTCCDKPVEATAHAG